MKNPESGTIKRLQQSKIARLAIAQIKSSAILLAIALSLVADGGSWAAATGQQAKAEAAAGQAQTTPAMEPSQQPHPPAPVRQSREAWRKRILHAHQPQGACTKATYPETQWHVVPCGAPPNRPVTSRKGVRPHIGGNGFGTDLIYQILTGSILQAEGSFDKVKGVTTENSNGNANVFSLQINTNSFPTGTCNAPPTPNPTSCRGWVQFIYDSLDHVAFFQYWLLDYGNSCPRGWKPDGDNDLGCFRNSQKVSTPAVTIAELGKMRLFASIGNNFGNPDDLGDVQIGDSIWGVYSGDPIDGAREAWDEIEFNVFGDGEGFPEADFNPGTTIVVRDTILAATGSTFRCMDPGTSGESNNLILSNQTPLVAAVGPPSLVFIESYPTKTSVVGSCDNAAIIGERHPIPFGGLHGRNP